MVSGQHIPRRTRAVAAGQGVSPLGLVLGELAMGLEIGGAELPVFMRGEDAFAQAFELFLWRYLQINLDQVNIVGGQLVFKVGNLLQALGALCRLDKAVAQVADHAFIRAAIENPILPAAGSRRR